MEGGAERRLTGFGEGDDLRSPRVEVVQFLLDVVVALIGLGGGPGVTFGGGGLLIEIPIRVLVAAVEELARILTLVVDPRPVRVARRRLRLCPVKGLQGQVPGHGGQRPVNVRASPQAEFLQDLMFDRLQPEIVRAGRGGVLEEAAPRWALVMHVMMMVMLLLLRLLVRTARTRLMVAAETRLHRRQSQTTKRQSYEQQIGRQRRRAAAVDGAYRAQTVQRGYAVHVGPGVVPP